MSRSRLSFFIDLAKIMNNGGLSAAKQASDKTLI